MINMGLTEEVRTRVCTKCDFYKEEEKLECAAFKEARKLVEQKKITLDDL
ncbi:hypothetical protein IPdc08_00203 [archaeon]|nr:hypothetical protein IPdc08_00203 [archaeon]